MKRFLELASELPDFREAERRARERFLFWLMGFPPRKGQEWKEGGASAAMYKRLALKPMAPKNLLALARTGTDGVVDLEMVCNRPKVVVNGVRLHLSEQYYGFLVPHRSPYAHRQHGRLSSYLKAGTPSSGK